MTLPSTLCSAQEIIRRELGNWIVDSIQRNRSIPYHGIHDEGSYTFSWDAYYFLTRNENVREYLGWLRDGFADWIAENYYHGYQPDGEVHHATEPFTHFIARFRTIDPENPVAPRLLDDAAEHAGNWSPDVPDWYDWTEHRLLSWRIGSRNVRTEAPDDYEEPDSVRVAMVALSAYLSTGQRRYLDFCIDYGTKWANAVLTDPEPKVAFWYSDDPEAYADRLTREGSIELSVELIAASGMNDYFLDLYTITGADLFRQAFERIAPHLISVVADHRNATSAAQLAKYRLVTGDTRFDSEIMTRLPEPPEWNADGFELLPNQEQKERRKLGIIFNQHVGHRFDQVRWATREGSGELVEISEPTPSAWSLAYQITGDTAYAARAMFLAAERLRIARAKLDDGREHGCGGFTVGALASGHGRADRSGDVNTVFGPIAMGCVRMGNAEQPLVDYPEGLPQQVVSLVKQTPKPEVVWRNTGDRTATFIWRDCSAPASSPVEVRIAPNEERSAPLHGSVPLMNVAAAQ